MARLASFPPRFWLARWGFGECSAEQGLNHGLPADIEPDRPLVELSEHALCQIDIHATDRPDYGELLVKYAEISSPREAFSAISSADIVPLINSN
jgi:hypothetical protein